MKQRRCSSTLLQFYFAEHLLPIQLKHYLLLSIMLLLKRRHLNETLPFWSCVPLRSIFEERSLGRVLKCFLFCCLHDRLLTQISIRLMATLTCPEILLLLGDSKKGRHWRRGITGLYQFECFRIFR